MTTDTNITEGFIAMVEAYKAKPELEATIAKLTKDVDLFQRHLASEQDVSRNFASQIDELNRQLAEVKKERDDAMFRNLELEELKDQIGTLAGQLLGKLKVPVLESPSAVTQPEAGSIMQTPPDIQETNLYDEKLLTGYPGPIDPIVVSPQPSIAPAQSEPAPSLTPGEPDGWERGKPYSYKPWYMTDAEWVSRGGFGPAKDEPKPDSDCIF